MKPDTFFNFFKKFIKNEIKVGEISILPNSVDESGNMLFQVKNPNLNSYSKECLTAFVSGELYDFCELTCSDFTEVMLNINLDCDQHYINNELNTQIKESLKEVKYLSVPYEYTDKEELLIEVEHLNYSIETDLSNSEIKVTNIVRPIKINGNLPTSELIDKYNYVIKRSRFLESEFIYGDLDKIVEKHPSFHDANWQLFYATTEFCF